MLQILACSLIVEFFTEFPCHVVATHKNGDEMGTLEIFSDVWSADLGLYADSLVLDVTASAYGALTALFKASYCVALEGDEFTGYQRCEET